MRQKHLIWLQELDLSKFKKLIMCSGSLADAPIVSNSIILYTLINYNSINQNMNFMILPHFTSPILSFVPQKISQYIKSEFFFYSHSTKEEYVVYISQGNELPHIQFDFYKANGEHVYWRKLTIEGVSDYEYESLMVAVSPNGKYLYFEINSSKYF